MIGSRFESPGSVSKFLHGLVAAAVIAGLLAACAPTALRPAAVDAPQLADFPYGYYAEAAARGQPVYRVEPALSLVVVEVRRGGSLAHLGHDHVVASHDVQGYVAPGDGRADLYIRLDGLVVDEPGLRAEAGLDTQPSESDIAGTRANLLGKVLRAPEHPYARASVSRADAGSLPNVVISLNGITQTMQVPMQVDSRADELRATGRFALAQTDFGITPFSILGGALQVRDLLTIRFRIHAVRIEGGSASIQ